MVLLNRIGAVFVLLAAGASGAAAGEGGAALPSDVAKAVERGQDFLRKSAKEIHGPKKEPPPPKPGERRAPPRFPRGGYDERAAHLAAYALVASGVSRADPAVKLLHGVIEDRLEKGEKQTYDLALTVLALLEEGPKDGGASRGAGGRRAVETALERLLKSQIANGAWSYQSMEGYGQGLVESGGDLSNTQFAVLALGAAERKRLKIPDAAWERIRKGFAKWYSPVQEAGAKPSQGSKSYGKRGGWGYGTQPGGGATGSMTCAGICSMILSEAAVRGKPVEGIDPDDLPEVVGALRYLAEDDLARAFPPAPPRQGGQKRAPVGLLMDLYHLYSIERTGALARKERIGKWDWYAEGASRLLAAQGEDGSWNGSYGPVVSTSFALLFLSRATEQTYGTKYRVGGDDRHALVGEESGEEEAPAIVEADPNAPAPEPGEVVPLHLPSSER